ncbi:MAG: HEAT repeat domain-containing protein [Methanoregula sp.]
MTDSMEAILKRLLVQHGFSVARNATRCEGLLRDTCPDRSREIFILTNAVRQRIPDDLHAPRHSLPLSLMKGFLAKRLCNELGFSDTAARWAVDCWAAALDLEEMHETPAAIPSHPPSNGNKPGRSGSVSPEILAQWEDDLRNGTPAARLGAIAGLAVTPDDGCIGLLIGALANDQADVRSAAFDILSSPGMGATPHLIDALDATDDKIVWRAALALGALRADAAVDPLVGLLQRDGIVPEAAIWALGEIRSSRASTPLLALLKHPSAAISRSAAEALEKIGGR